jgi:hypothetical protein
MAEEVFRSPAFMPALVLDDRVDDVVVAPV